MRMTWQDQLARIQTKRGQRAAELSATPEQNEAKKRFGRIFQTAHATLRLAQRGLGIDRERVRSRLLEITGDRAALFDNRTNTHIPVFRLVRKNRADDWSCKTVYQVDDEEAAKRKAAKDGSALIPF